MNIENFAKMRGLELAHQSLNSALLDSVFSGDQGDEVREKLQTKRLQFDTSPVLYSKVEDMCEKLNCSKREFMEMAMLEAVERAELAWQQGFEDGTGRDIADVYPAPVEA